jgi:hypothetical protein
MPGAVDVSLLPPQGLGIEEVAAANGVTSFKLAGHGGSTCARIYHPDPTFTHRQIVIALAPSEALDPDTPLAPAGDWTICVSNLGLEADVSVHLWVQRDDTVEGFPSGGRQSYFVESDEAWNVYGDGRPIESFCVVRRSDTLNGMATGMMTITVAGYRRSDAQMAPYSSCGRTSEGAQRNQLPNFAAPVEEGTSHRGTLAAGTRSGSIARLRGTSFAAPQVGRLIGDLAAEHVDAAERISIMAARDEARAPELSDTADFQIGRRGCGRLTRLEMSLDTNRYRGPRREARLL